MFEELRRAAEHRWFVGRQRKNLRVSADFANVGSVYRCPGALVPHLLSTANGMAFDVGFTMHCGQPVLFRRSS